MTTTPRSGSTTTRDLDRGRLDTAFALVRRQVDEGVVPAAALAVGTSRGLVRCEGFAPASGPPVTPETLFLIASITKPIVATAVMQLVEGGLLDLHEPVATVLPEFQPVPAPGTAGTEAITPWHILTHTSGISDQPLEGFVMDQPDRATLLHRACTGPLTFPPGTRYEYGSNSFYVLGELIHRLTGLDYAEYLQARIFEPLGMTSTAFDPADRGERRAPLHLPGFDEPAPPIVTDYVASLALPGGGLWSTAPDLIRFGAALLRADSNARAPRPAILRPETIELMTREHTAGIKEGGFADPHYALGWSKPSLTGAMPGSLRTFSHGGATGTILWVDPDADLVIVYLMNQWGAGSEPNVAAVRAVYAAIG